MNWIYSLIVLQCTILLLHARPETSSLSPVATVGMESSQPAIQTSQSVTSSVEIAETPASKMHLTTNVAAPSTKRLLVTSQVKKVEPIIKKVTKAPELVTFSTVSVDADSKTTRAVDELKQKALVTPTPKAEPSIATTQSAEKPTIYDIIAEAERNRTQQTSRQHPVASTVSPPLALPLSSQMPTFSDSPKAIGHHVEIHTDGHPGVAEPLTWQQLESEMSIVDQSLKESSTSKDGISTWILLSGSDKQQPLMATPATTTVSHVEKFDVQEKLNDRQNYRFGEIHGDKIVKPVKTRDSIDNKKPKPDKKNKNTNSTVAVKTTLAPSSTSGILVASDFTTEKNRRKTPLANINKVNNKRKTTTTTTTTTAAPIVSKDKIDHAPTTLEAADATTPVSFIVLEPKDADFDLPQDRSPATKKPQKATTKAKRKPSKKNKVTAVTKTPAKIKEKPISTTIYNYLSREVMPSVGILGAGILLTAGLASYIFGPFGALRRSYDNAADRQDNVDNIYSVNSEEYAGEGTDSGQHEEEVFSKFLAGMPSRDVPQYVKYFKGDANKVNAMGPNSPYRYQVRLQQQANNVAPKYSPYMRYRTAPSPHFNQAQYNPQQQYPAYRNHQANSQAVQQPVHQAVQQPVSPVYNPQYHDMQKQKSFTNNMDTILKHQTTIYGKSQTSSNVIEEKSTGSQIQAEPEEQKQMRSDDPVTEMKEDDNVDEISAKIQRRTNTYVVGSAITDTQPGEAVVSASMTASVDGLPSEGIVEPVITVTASSHGPRRRRREVNMVTKAPPQETTDKTTEQHSSTTTTTTTTTAAPMPITRLYNSNEWSELGSEFSMLNEKIMSFDRDYTNEETEKKIEKKIQTEFNSISNDYDALKKAIDGAKAIEQFQKQVKIRAKNFELSVVLKTGISTLRQRIKYLNDLVEHPEDSRIIEKINRRDGSSESTPTNSTSPNASIPESENGFVGFLKLIQLKAQFGLNLLQNIRPSFERAFEEVFKKPYEKPN